MARRKKDPETESTLGAIATPSPFKLAKLRLLADNDTAVAMVIAWPVVGKMFKRGHLRLQRPLQREWARVAGIAPHDILIWEAMLFKNGLISEDGVVAPEVVTFLEG